MPGKRYTYEEMVDMFKEFKCELMTTQDKYDGDRMTGESKFDVRMPCGHDREIYPKHIREKPDMLCKDCTRKRTYGDIYYVNAVKRFEGFGCKLLTSRQDFIDNNMQGNDTFEYEASCGHYNVGSVQNFRKNVDALCKDCMKKVRYDGMRLPYEEVKARFEKDGCELLTTEAEYYDNGMTVYDEYALRMTCGHERKCSYASWTGCDITLCKECTLVRTKANAKQAGGKIDGNARGNVIEYRAFVWVRELIEHAFDVKKLREGTLADFLVKPKGVRKNAWLSVQLKSTLQATPKKGYCFSFRQTDYTGMVILCVCVPDEKAWTFRGEDVKNLSGVGIREKSKYNKAQVDALDIPMVLLSHYETIPHMTYEDANVPVSATHIVEYEHQQLRESRLDGILRFEYPELEGQVFDFMVGTIKVQEKSGHHCKDVSLPTTYVKLTKHYGDTKRMSYEQGDNDVYWVSCPDKDTFYVFPESILIEKGFISTAEKMSVKRTLTLHWEAQTVEELTNCHSQDAWAFPYRYKYSNLDVDKLQEVFM